MFKHSKTIVASVLTLAASSVFLAAPIAAQTTTTTSKLGSQIATTACTRVTEKIANLTTRFDENKERHINRYNQIKTNVTNTVDKLAGKGYDVTQIRADLATLNDKIKDFTQEYVLFIDTLKSTQDVACGHSGGDFKAKVEEARGYLKDSREKARDIITFLRETIKPDLQALKSQKTT